MTPSVLGSDPVDLTPEQSEALSTLVEAHTRHETAWNEKCVSSEDRLAAVGVCRSVGLTAAVMADATGLTTGRVHQLFTQIREQERARERA